MAYIGLGARPATGTADTTGNNAGKWTVQFTPQIIGINVPHFELYKIVVTGAANTATFNVYVNTNQWDTAVYATNNSWDPSQPLLLTPGDTIYFYYSSASSDGNQPKIFAWFRYDPAITQVFGIRALWAGRHRASCSCSRGTRSSTRPGHSPTQAARPLET